jgi:hypothetical protein
VTRSKDSIALGFGPAQYAGLVVAGLGGMIPFTAWVTPLLLAAFPENRPVHGLAAIAQAVCMVGFLAGLLVGTWLVPCLVLRARQPRGARVAWDDEAVVEWDGPWKRSVVPWARAEAALVRWVVRSRSGPTTYEAVQLVDRAKGAVITAWQTAPKGAPLVRRRLCSGDVPALRAAVEARGIPRVSPDWMLAVDPDRPRPLVNVVLGRVGYLLGFSAGFASPLSHAAGTVLCVAGVALLAFRAVPVLAEVRAIRARLASAARTAEASAGAGPYRVASSVPPEDDGRHAADRLKLRAVMAEALLRLAFVALPIAATVTFARLAH